MSPLCVLLFVIWSRLWNVMKMMTNVESKLNEEEFFADAVDILKKGVREHGKRECLQGAISKGKVYFLGGKNNGHMKDLSSY